MKSKYRIVPDRYLGYEVQVKKWYWPFWRMPFINTNVSIRQAKVLISVLQSLTPNTDENGK